MSSAITAHVARRLAYVRFRIKNHFGLPRLKDPKSPEGRSPERSEGELIVRISMSALQPKADVDRDGPDV
jgi:hypothetical protein